MSRAPNVLTIDHSEDPVSDSSGSDQEERDDEDQGFVSRQDTQPSDEDTQLSPNSNNSVEPPSPRLKPAGTVCVLYVDGKMLFSRFPYEHLVSR